MEKHEKLETLNIGTVEFNPEFLMMIRPLYHEKFKQMSLKYDPYDSMDFDCEKMLLTSLEGAPQSINRGFYCNDNQLTSLKGAPQSVGWSFYCINNRLTSLEGAPQSVNGGFACSNNQLTSLKGAPQYVGGSFSCNDNPLTTLEGAPQKVGGSFFCGNNPKLSDAQIDHYKKFLKGEHQECLVDGHYMPPESLRGEQNV